MGSAKEILYEILKLREIERTDDISEFLSAKPQKAYNPFLLLNMEAGVDLLLSEIKSGSRICIYGDYDADGVTSICIMMSVLSALTHNIMYYIPSRFEEGYGLNNEAIDRVKAQGAELLITVDCGSVSYDEVEYAKSLGMKVIVTDHHSIDSIKADCILINPKQKECAYPFKGLAGCGVAFKFAQAVTQRAALGSHLLHKALDFVAIGTVGDIVPLVDENRTLVKYGLAKINDAGGRKSIRSLVEAISIPYVTAERIAYGLAPHINAAGRMAQAKIAAELLLSERDGEIDRLVSQLVEYNGRRRKLQDEAYDKCSQRISGQDDFLVLRMDDMHEGIGGIVAGKIKENFYRPVVILTPSGQGLLKGTGRSIPGVDIYRLLKNHDELFIRFGGHESACGFLIPEENMFKFRELVNTDIAILKEKTPSLFERENKWELKLTPGEATVELAKELMFLEPCGEGNQKPVFYIEDVQPSSLKFMGSEEQHLKFTVTGRDGSSLECVFFGRAQEKKDLLDGGSSVDIMGRVSLHIWRGSESVQFIVEEIL
ncbi:MAG: single-stranded-DNA-specific exonuclease RecJ [Clostridiales bacterium]|nr:single-stranded-DNA-specific exonuclease RecJ [Clostridiales bacterium]